MGVRATFKLVPRDLARIIYNEKDSEVVFSLLEDCEFIAHDFCTDSLIACYNKLSRLTRSKLSCECDIALGRMNRSSWDLFTAQVHKDATRQATTGMPQRYWDQNLSRVYSMYNKWKLTDGIDWISAYFQCVYISKIIDWTKYLIIFEIG